MNQSYTIDWYIISHWGYDHPCAWVNKRQNSFLWQHPPFSFEFVVNLKMIRDTRFINKHFIYFSHENGKNWTNKPAIEIVSNVFPKTARGARMVE